MKAGQRGPNRAKQGRLFPKPQHTFNVTASATKYCSWRGDGNHGPVVLTVWRHHLYLLVRSTEDLRNITTLRSLHQRRRCAQSCSCPGIFETTAVLYKAHTCTNRDDAMISFMLYYSYMRASLWVCMRRHHEAIHWAVRRRTHAFQSALVGSHSFLSREC